MSTDALSDVLSAVHLSGFFFDVTAKSPWVAEAPPAAQVANDLEGCSPGMAQANGAQLYGR